MPLDNRNFFEVPSFDAGMLDLRVHAARMSIRIDAAHSAASNDRFHNLRRGSRGSAYLGPKLIRIWRNGRNELFCLARPSAIFNRC